KMPEVVIDFENLHRRIHRIAIPHSTESGLFWSPDSKKLAFTATVEGKRGTYAVEVPDDPKPKPLTTQTGSQARCLQQGNQILRLSNGLRASFTPGAANPAAPEPAAPVSSRRSAPAAPTGESAAGGYRFQALQRVDLSQHNRAAFDLC